METWIQARIHGSMDPEIHGSMDRTSLCAPIFVPRMAPEPSDDCAPVLMPQDPADPAEEVQTVARCRSWVLYLAGAEIACVCGLRQIWPWMFGFLMIAIQTEAMIMDLAIHEVESKDLPNPEFLLYLGWFFIHFAAIVHWVGLLILCGQEVGLMRVKGGTVARTGITLAVGLVLALANGALSAPFDVGSAAYYLQHSVWALGECQIALVHWATAILLQGECIALLTRIPLDTREAREGAKNSVRAVQKRWRLFIVAHCVPELLATMFVALGALGSAAEDFQSLAKRSLLTFAFLTSLFLVQLKPLADYNYAIMEAVDNAASFEAFQVLRKLHLRFCGILVEPGLFWRTAFMLCGTFFSMIAKQLFVLWSK